MRVAALVVAVGDDDVGPLRTDDADQLARRPRRSAPGGTTRGARSGRCRPCRSRGSPSITTSSKPMISADRGQLAGAQLGEALLLLLGGQAVERLAWFAQRRVLQIAFLAAGATHQHGVHAFGRVHRHRRRALRRFVVGMSVHGEQTEPFLHGRERYRGAGRPRRLTRRASPRRPPHRLGSRSPSSAAGCRRDGREMRPALPSQDGSVSTTAPPTVPVTEDDFFNTAADASPALPGGTDRAFDHRLAGTGSASPATVPGVGRHRSMARRRADRPEVHLQGRQRLPGTELDRGAVGTQEIAVTMIDQRRTASITGRWPASAPTSPAWPRAPSPRGRCGAQRIGAPGLHRALPAGRLDALYRITVHFLDQPLLWHPTARPTTCAPPSTPPRSPPPQVTRHVHRQLTRQPTCDWAR